MSTRFEFECRPVRSTVSCEIAQNDMFGGAAALEPKRLAQSYRVAGGPIVEIGPDGSSRTPDEQQRRLEQIADTYPDRHAKVFRGPSCGGCPAGMLFTSGSIGSQHDLAAEWCEVSP
jgi:hypothetical protein